jgi:hypothetical protein
MGGNTVDITDDEYWITKNSQGEYFAHHHYYYTFDDVNYVPVLKSTDGINWSFYVFSGLRDTYLWGTILDYIYVPYLDKHVCILGNPSTGGKRFLSTSDFLVWDFQSFSNISRIGTAYLLCCSDEIVIAIGEGNDYLDTSGYYDVYRKQYCCFNTTDGVQWNTSNLMSANRRFRDVVWSPELELFVATGTTWNVTTTPNSDGYDRLVVSSNGIGWSEYNLGNDKIYNLTWSPILMKFYGVRGGKLVYSEDGVYWVNTDHFEGVDDVRWLGGINKLVVLVGDVLYYSDDGENWGYLRYLYPQMLPDLRQTYNALSCYYDEETSRFIKTNGKYCAWGVDGSMLPNIASIDGEKTYIKARFLEGES